MKIKVMMYPFPKGVFFLRGRERAVMLMTEILSVLTKYNSPLQLIALLLIVTLFSILAVIALKALRYLC